MPIEYILIIVQSFTALIILYYAIQTRKLVKERRKDRIRKSKIRIFKEILDPLINELGTSKLVVERAKDGKWGWIKKRYDENKKDAYVLYDFAEDHPKLEEKINKYLQFRWRFNQRYKTLKDEVKDKIDSFIDEDLEQNINEILKEKGRKADRNQDIERVIEHILDKPSGVSSSDYRFQIYEENKEKWLELREKESVKNKMKGIREVLTGSEIDESFIQNLKEELEELRDDYRSEFGIRPSQIYKGE